MMIISYLSTAEHLAGLQEALQSAARQVMLRTAAERVALQSAPQPFAPFTL
jgi:hypothetical protein